MGYPIPGGRGYTTGLELPGQQKFFPDADVVETGGPMAMTSSRAYARYVGQAPRTITAADLHAYIHGAAAVAGAGGATLNWAEVAIASGPISTSLQASLDLTLLAYAPITAEAVAAASSTLASKAVSGFSLGKDLGIWVIVACAFQTTNMSMRYVLGTDVQGYARTRNSCQPSLNLNTPLAFTTVAPTAALVPYLAVQTP
jgi:hypothetical protein